MYLAGGLQHPCNTSLILFSVTNKAKREKKKKKKPFCSRGLEYERCIKKKIFFHIWEEFPFGPFEWAEQNEMSNKSRD